MPKSQDGQGVEPEPAEELSVARRRGGTRRWVLALGAGARRARVAAQRASAAVISADNAEREPDADGVGDRPEHGAEDGAQDCGAERRPEQLAAPLAGEPRRWARPARLPTWRCSRSPGRTERSPSAQGPSASDEAKLEDSEQGEPGNDGELRYPARGGDPARNPAEQRPGAEGSDEQPGAGLGEAELLRVAGHERREDAEQQRVDEQDYRPREREAGARADVTGATSPPSRRTEPESPVPDSSLTRARVVSDTFRRLGPLSRTARRTEPSEPTCGSEPRDPTPRSFQGVLARNGSLPGIRFYECAINKFSEPGALSSATPTNFRLPPTAYRCGLDLLASRARCKGESRGDRPAPQGLEK